MLAVPSASASAWNFSLSPLLKLKMVLSVTLPVFWSVSREE